MVGGALTSSIQWKNCRRTFTRLISTCYTGVIPIYCPYNSILLAIKPPLSPSSLSLWRSLSLSLSLSLSPPLAMDTLLEAPSMAKRPCVCANDPVLRHSHCCLNPRVSQSDQMEGLLEAFLELSDSSGPSLHLSFEKLLDSRACDSDQNLLIDRALRLGSALLEAGKRSARKRASIHNSLTWALPPDLTIKVCFSFGKVWLLVWKFWPFFLGYCD